MGSSASAQVGHVRRSTPRDVTLLNTYCVQNPTNCCNDNATFVGLKVQITRYRVPVNTFDGLTWLTAAGCNVPCCGSDANVAGIVVQRAVFAVPASWQKVGDNACAVDACNGVYDGGMLWDGSAVDYTRSSGGMLWDGTAGGAMASTGGVLWDGTAVKPASDGGVLWDGSGVVTSNGGMLWDGSGVPNLSTGGALWDGTGEVGFTDNVLLDGDPEVGHCQKCTKLCVACCATHLIFHATGFGDDPTLEPDITPTDGACVHCNVFWQNPDDPNGYSTLIWTNSFITGHAVLDEAQQRGCFWVRVIDQGPDPDLWFCHMALNDLFETLYFDGQLWRNEFWSISLGQMSPSWLAETMPELRPNVFDAVPQVPGVRFFDCLYEGTMTFVRDGVNANCLNWPLHRFFVAEVP